MFVSQKLLAIPYPRYVQLQEKLRQRRREGIVFLEHPACITLGTATKMNNLLAPPELLSEKNIELVRIKRGGDATAHEPGQLVVYLHFDLKKRQVSVTKFVHTLLASVSQLLEKIFQIKTISHADAPGLYLEAAPEKKLVSIGLGFKSFFTSFGFAINVRNDCKTFQFINPCGQSSSNIVSLQKLQADTGQEIAFIREFPNFFLQQLAAEKSTPQ